MNPMKLSPKMKIGIIIVLIIILLVVLNVTAINKEVKNFFYLISAPIQKSLWKVGDRVSDFFEAITEIKNLKKEAENLKLKNQELLAEIALLKELKRENEILREALEIGLEKEFRLALVKVLGKDISQDSLVIDKGSKDGIFKDLPVITQQKTLVGKISEVYENFSKVQLLTDKESSFDAKISETEIYGVIKGRGNFKVYLELILGEEEIKEGDLVVTTPLGGIFPGGILVGQVKEVKKSDVEPFQQAEIRPAFDIKKLEMLFIITEFK